MTPVDLRDVVLTALLNPAVIVVAFWMGRSADQWQKLPVAAFAAALAGSVLVYVAARLGISRRRRRGSRRGRDLHRPIPVRPGLGLPGTSARAPRPVTMLRLWLIGTSVILAALAVWAFAPVLFFVLLLTAALGAVSAVMIGLARALRAWRERR